MNVRAHSFLLLCLPLVLLAGKAVMAQNFPVTPANPTAFEKRNVGGSLGSASSG